jgi:hypothetical protein
VSIGVERNDRGKRPGAGSDPLALHFEGSWDQIKRGGAVENLVVIDPPNRLRIGGCGEANPGSCHRSGKLARCAADSVLDCAKLYRQAQFRAQTRWP